ncbi:MAG: AraC family transcriptional regulator [Planctomycetota bacterium]|jgi:AraC family transcriptional regulator|nr:AraC family transcriptional regulator [Planctomycetota bacterium]
MQNVGLEILRGSQQTNCKFAPPPAELVLPARVYGGGYELRRDHYDWHGLQRGGSQAALIQCTVGGEGRLDYEGREHVLVPGTVLVVHWPHNSRYWLPAGCHWEFVWLIMGGGLLFRMWRAISARCQGLAVLDQALFERCVADVTHLLTDEVDGLEASRVAYGLALSLYGAVHGDDEGLNAQLATARDFALSHLADGIGVDDMAAAADMSRAHFSRRFQQAIGRPPGAWLIEQRLAQAAERLLGGDDGMAAIAMACGFADANYFGKAFRRVYGVTPGSYRAMFEATR